MTLWPSSAAKFEQRVGESGGAPPVAGRRDAFEGRWNVTPRSNAPLRNRPPLEWSN